jgi:hypothetical protein
VRVGNRLGPDRRIGDEPYVGAQHALDQEEPDWQPVDETGDGGELAHPTDVDLARRKGRQHGGTRRERLELDREPHLLEQSILLRIGQ